MAYLVGGWAGDHGVCWWLVDGLASDVVLVSDLDGAGSSLNGAGSENAVLDVGAGDSGASMDLLAHVAWARGESRDGTDGAIADSGGSGGSGDDTSGGGGGDSSNCCVPGGSSRANSSAESSQNLQGRKAEGGHSLARVIIFRIHGEQTTTPLKFGALIFPLTNI